MALDFIARKLYYIDHLKPVWDALPAEQRGDFYLPENLYLDLFARNELRQIPAIENHYQPYIEMGECGNGPILAAAYPDAVRAADANPKRPVILIEHGAGLTFGKSEYADGLGQRYKFALMPVQSEYILAKVHPELKHIPHPVVGVPKLDKWAGEFIKDHPIPDKPTIAVAFHHGDKESSPPEIGSAWEHYVDILPELAKRYKLILHAHPTANPYYIYGDFINQAEYVKDFDEVMRRADIYVNDCSSTLFEFCVTGKPVILLNAPWFYHQERHTLKKEYWGLRFWDYTDIGPQVEDGSQLLDAIERTIQHPDEFKPYRSRMVNALFPFLGQSTNKMLSAIYSVIGKDSPLKPTIESVPNLSPTQPPEETTIQPAPPKPIRASKERGIIYAAFGSNAWREMANSLRSLRATGCDLPVSVVGDRKLGMKWVGDYVYQSAEAIGDISAAFKFIEWTGESPFNKDEHRVNFQFQAAIVKSALYEISPYKETIYVDVDTEFLQDPEIGFSHLKHWDFCVAQEPQSIAQLYNEPNPRHWEHDLPERDLTIKEMGGDGNFPMINSGVFFWRRNEAVRDLFLSWYSEWGRFKKWDEQKSLWRALEKSRVRLFLLSAGWNTNNREEAVMIYHKYGQCTARQGDEK